MNMFPFLKSRRKKHEIQVIDLTIGSTLEDDYILPTRLVHELSVRGIRANCTPIVAEQRITEWEAEFSIQSIRNALEEEDWDLVIERCNVRLSVHTESEPLIHLIRTYYRLEKYDYCLNKCAELLQINQNDLMQLDSLQDVLGTWKIMKKRLTLCENLGNRTKTPTLYYR